MTRHITPDAVQKDLAAIDREIITLQREKEALLAVARALGTSTARTRDAATGTTKPRVRRDSRSEEAQQTSIIKVLREAEAPYSSDRIAAAAGLSLPTIRRRLQDLLKTGQIVETTGKKRGQRFAAAPDSATKETRIKPGVGIIE